MPEAIRFECSDSSRRRVGNLLQRLYDSGARDAGLLAGITTEAIAHRASHIALLAPVDKCPCVAVVAATPRLVQALAGSTALVAQSRWPHEIRVSCHVARFTRMDLTD